MTPETVPSFHDAYPAVLRRIQADPDHDISTRGNISLEVLDVCFRITDPRQRVPYLVTRPINIAYNWAEVLWYVCARNDLDMIGYYAPSMAHASGDGHTLTGTAYGPPIFGPRLDGRSQWERVLDLLGKDPDSKRAVLSVFGPDELADLGNPDVSCTIAAQFLLREGALHASVYMRGNDAFMGMPSDVFSFTVLQELAAVLLGARLGTYTHHVGSMHLNQPHRAKTRKLLAELDKPGYQPPALTFPAMPATPPMRQLQLLAEQEEQLRLNQVQHTCTSVTTVGLEPYWQQVLLIFEAYRQIQHSSQPLDPEVLAALDPAYRWLLTRRWPKRMPGAAA